MHRSLHSFLPSELAYRPNWPHTHTLESDSTPLVRSLGPELLRFPVIEALFILHQLPASACARRQRSLRAWFLSIPPNDNAVALATKIWTQNICLSVQPSSFQYSCLAPWAPCHATSSQVIFNSTIDDIMSRFQTPRATFLWAEAECTASRWARSCTCHITSAYLTWSRIFSFICVCWINFRDSGGAIHQPLNYGRAQ